MADIDSMGKTLETTLDGPVSLLNRMRLACMPITREGTALECAKPGMSSAYILFCGSDKQLEMQDGK